jgi:hypothetical protein
MSHGKPSDLVYMFLKGIATIVTGLARLTGLLGRCLWLGGMRLIKISQGSTPSKMKFK